MFGDPEGESATLFRAGEERLRAVRVATQEAREGALWRTCRGAPTRRIAPCRDPGRPGRNDKS